MSSRVSNLILLSVSERTDQPLDLASNKTPTSRWDAVYPVINLTPPVAHTWNEFGLCWYECTCGCEASLKEKDPSALLPLSLHLLFAPCPRTIDDDTASKALTCKEYSSATITVVGMLPVVITEPVQYDAREFIHVSSVYIRHSGMRSLEYLSPNPFTSSVTGNLHASDFNGLQDITGMTVKGQGMCVAVKANGLGMIGLIMMVLRMHP